MLVDGTTKLHSPDFIVIGLSAGPCGRDTSYESGGFMYGAGHYKVHDFGK